MCVSTLPMPPPLVLFARRRRISRALSMTRRKVSSTSLAGTLHSASPKPLQPPSHTSGRKYVASAQHGLQGRAVSHQPWGVDSADADGSEDPQFWSKEFMSDRPGNLSRRFFQFRPQFQRCAVNSYPVEKNKSVLSAFEFLSYVTRFTAKSAKCKWES